MRTRSERPGRSAHSEAVDRRLALLRADLAEGAPESESSDDGAEALSAGIPFPGRHASYRRLDLVPEVLRGRVQVEPWHLVVVAVVVVVALIATCWWLVRGRSTEIAAPAPVASASPLATLASAAPAASAPASAVASGVASGVASAGPSGAVGASTQTVTVDVEGKVRRPGIAKLPSGSRVIDAIKKAGGAIGRRHLAGLNLASVLIDGQQILVGGGGVAAGSVPAAAAAPTDTSGALLPGQMININTATDDQLQTLPDVGPVTAQSILDWRTENGSFSSVDDLLEVDGIGPVTLEKLRPHVTV